ncbi:MAG: DUF4296 domain-containing protein [Ignavibacteriae bacterium]|nr:DUF4296 domain-containing protein [Ignavibacteriota bacterium]
MLSFALSACGGDSAPPVPRERLAAAQADALVAAQLLHSDSVARVRTIDSIYRAHGIDTASVRHAAEWYAKHPEERARLYDEIIGRLERRGDSLKRP